MSVSARNGRLALSIALLVLAVDQLSKWWILQVVNLPALGSVPAAPGFHLTMVWNRGVSFGLLRADGGVGRWLLVAFSIAVAIGLAVWARRAARPLLAVALGLVIGGAVGNAIDRARFGAVVDFLDFTRLYFPWVFNIADAGISVGVALLVLDSLLSERAEKAAARG